MTCFRHLLWILFAGLCSCKSLPLQNSYQLKLTHNSNVLRFFVVEEDTEFAVIWIHSVEDEAWEEQFVISNGMIVLHSTRFRTFGAGVPYDAPQTEIKAGWVQMSGFLRPVDPLYFRVNRKTAHTLILGKEKIPFPPGRIHIAVQKLQQRRR